MPGVPAQQVTPDQFRQWKMQKDQEREQASDRAFNTWCCTGHLPMLFMCLQAKLNVEHKRQADIDSGRVSMTGMVFTLCPQCMANVASFGKHAAYGYVSFLQVESYMTSILSYLLTISRAESTISKL